MKTVYGHGAPCPYSTFLRFDIKTLSALSNTADVSGIILAGGKSSRLGQNKALVDAAGMPLVQRVVDRLYMVVQEVIVVTDRPDDLAFLGLPTASDVYHGIGTLAGLHAGLAAMGSVYGLVVGCDMPLLNVGLLRHIVSLRDGYDVVMPRLGEYYEPLHALYSKRCMPSIERAIKAGQRRMLSACAGMRVRYVRDDEIASYDPRHLSFFNVNDARDLAQMAALLSTEDGS
jgi:molybdopterin-guanine dinucleotide biosynthesis protein A